MTFNKANPDPLTETPDSLTTYVIGDDVIAQTVDGTTQYLLYDGHGSTRQLAEYDSAVSIADTYSYDGYGVLLQDNAVASSNPGKVGTQATNLLYAGEQFDTDAQQYYLRARYYNQNTGRFNRMDPFTGNSQDPQSLHKYLYVHCNPVNNIDPSGLMTTAISLNIGMAIGALIMSIIAIDMIGYLQGRASITGAYMETMQLALDYALDGLFGVAAAIRSHSKAVQKAIEKAIDAAKSAGRAVKKLLKLKKFIFFKFMMPNIFAFNIRALSTNPSWFVLNYLADPIKATANRRFVTARYGHLRRPGRMSIDEFPYASTREGGRGALGEAVPIWENWVQGGYLGAFYRWRLKSTPQPFLVVPVPI